MSSCIDCFNNCSDIFSDKCVKYTGPDVPSLGISSNDPLFNIENILITQAQQTATGESITPAGVTLGCSFLTTIQNGKPQTLSNLLQTLATGECSLNASISALNAVVFAPFTINAPCLTLPINPTLTQVVQVSAAQICTNTTDIATIVSDYVKQSTLCTQVNACITASTQYNTRMVPYVAYPYHGPLYNFDAGGAGLPANGFDRVFICNGQVVGTFPTPDYRGRSPLGANVGIPGGALDVAVDPAQIANAGYGVTIGVKKGTFTDVLTTTQLAAHTHSVTDPGHKHSYVGVVSDGRGADASKAATTTTLQTASSITGISINPSGNNQPHNSTHPVIGCVFIMYIP